jgi:hypothetical protein
LNSLGDTARQGANAGMRQKDFVASHRKLVLSQFFVREEFGYRHRWKVKKESSTLKA